MGSRLAHGDFYLDAPIASFAWPLLVQAGGLARKEGGRLGLTPKGRTALGAPSAEVIRGLWRRWLSHAVIDEFSRIEEIKGQRAANVLTAVGHRRRAVAAALTACPAGEWIDVDDLFATMRRSCTSSTRSTGAWATTLITHDRALRGLCRSVGERHVAVPLKHELKFRKALLRLGYVLPG